MDISACNLLPHSCTRSEGWISPPGLESGSNLRTCGESGSAVRCWCQTLFWVSWNPSSLLFPKSSSANPSIWLSPSWKVPKSQHFSKKSFSLNFTFFDPLWPNLKTSHTSWTLHACLQSLWFKILSQCPRQLGRVTHVVCPTPQSEAVAALTLNVRETFHFYFCLFFQ